ncbi:tetratricopeptide repeat protein 19, mitochondrial [Paragonimus westermani]|uniref:Tetratricopeptide repeat protein 19, mitochondrial n=1 Tax=Paragonimus westermani TaxID=34504 RepID=A0A5J4NUX2_9TREM|nr:tetratricopeptide repeat protein 19, mitochondrial [Paragonimus westermani]
MFASLLRWANTRRVTNRRTYPITTALAFIWPFARDPDPVASVDKITVQLFRQATQAVVEQQFVQADHLLHELLHHLWLAHEEGILDMDRYMRHRARVCSELANVNLLLARYSEAEQLIKQTIRDCTALGVPLDDAMIVELSLKLALVFEQVGRMEEAAMGFVYCIRAQEKKLNGQMEDEQLANERALLGMCHNYYSKFLFKVGRPTSALDHAKLGLRLAEQLYGADHPNSLHLLCDIAVILIELKQLDEARKELNQARCTVETQLSKSSGQTLDELRLCLAHILLQCVVLEAVDGQISTANQLISQLDQLLQCVKPTDRFLQQLKEYRTTFGLER